jgi:hypothetical protein
MSDELEPVAVYECPHDQTHALPGPEVRLLKVGDGGFIAACACGPEPLSAVDEPPHESVDHLVNIYVDDPSPAQWLRLEDATQGWYDSSTWESPDGYAGTYGQRRARFRRRVEEIATTSDGRSLEPSETGQRARSVACPKCGATEGRKCKRPSGHRVRTPHAARVDALEDADPDRPSRDQSNLARWA